MRKRHLFAVILASASIALFAGCGSDDTTDSSIEQEAADNNTDTSETDAEDESDSTPAKPVKDLFNSMETVDLDGNAVDTSLFSQYKMTMVNTWNTGCNPCIHEIPILDQLNQDLEEQNISIKGLIFEYEPGLSDSGRKDVEAILGDSGATYQQLLISEDMMNSPTLRQLTAFPTTYFVDPDGEIFASTVGANDYDGWMDIIDQALDILEENE